tara:strand:- start:27 stop:269 length:243 start_codon:yes stop_codon:yes gene_type:complete
LPEKKKTPNSRLETALRQEKIKKKKRKKRSHTEIVINEILTDIHCLSIIGTIKLIANGTDPTFGAVGYLSEVTPGTHSEW